MHSTVQTGLFSQNLFNQQSNDHQFHNYASSSQTPSRYANFQPPGHHHYYFQPPVSTRHRHSNTSRDITSSMLAIDGGLGGDGSSLSKSAKLNLSSQNISKLPAFVFLSTTNLDRINSNKNINTAIVDGGGGDCLLKKQSSSSSSIIGQIVSSSNLTRNISGNFNESNLNANANHHHSSGEACDTKTSNPNLAHQNHHGYPKRSFWDCTKPCGLLTTGLGITLLLSSALSALFLLENSLCTTFGTCSNALVTLYAFSALVCGIVLVFIGMVIVVYTKKDVRVIVTTAKNFDKIVHYKQQQPGHHNSHHQNQKASSNSPAKLSSSNSPGKSTSNRKIHNQQLSVDVALPVVDPAAVSVNLPLLDPKSEQKKLMA